MYDYVPCLSHLGAWNLDLKGHNWAASRTFARAAPRQKIRTSSQTSVTVEPIRSLASKKARLMVMMITTSTMKTMTIMKKMS